jgi:hypothetical protein
LQTLLWRAWATLAIEIEIETAGRRLTIGLIVASSLILKGCRGVACLAETLVVAPVQLVVARAGASVQRGRGRGARGAASGRGERGFVVA